MMATEFKIIDFESISKEVLNGKIEILLQNDKIIKRLNRKTNLYHLNKNLLNSSVIDIPRNLIIS